MWWPKCLVLTLCLFITLFLEANCETNPKMISELEKQFLAGMGLTKRPTVSKKSLEIPEKIIEEYFSKTGIKIDPTHFSDKVETGEIWSVKLNSNILIHSVLVTSVSF